jgi:hypothetical protein
MWSFWADKEIRPMHKVWLPILAAGLVCFAALRCSQPEEVPKLTMPVLPETGCEPATVEASAGNRATTLALISELRAGRPLEDLVAFDSSWRLEASRQHLQAILVAAIHIDEIDANNADSLPTANELLHEMAEALCELPPDARKTELRNCLFTFLAEDVRRLDSVGVVLRSAFPDRDVFIRPIDGYDSAVAVLKQVVLEGRQAEADFALRQLVNIASVNSPSWEPNQTIFEFLTELETGLSAGEMALANGLTAKRIRSAKFVTQTWPSIDETSYFELAGLDAHRLAAEMVGCSDPNRKYYAMDVLRDRPDAIVATADFLVVMADQPNYRQAVLHLFRRVGPVSLPIPVVSGTVDAAIASLDENAAQPDMY